MAPEKVIGQARKNKTTPILASLVLGRFDVWSSIAVAMTMAPTVQIQIST